MQTVHDWVNDTSENVPNSSIISPYVLIADSAKIGKECYIGPHCVVESGVEISDGVTVGSGVRFCSNVIINESVSIGSNVTFTEFCSDKTSVQQSTVVEVGAVIGDGSVVFNGICIGQYARIAPGTLLNRSIPPNALVEGNPSRIVGYVNATNTSRVDVGIRNDRSSYDSIVNGVFLHSFPLIKDIRGSLTVGEFERSIPFPVKRYFIVFDVPSAETRGEHAHYKCHQFLLCVKGSISVVADDGHNREEFVLNRPELGLYLPPMTWGIQYKYSSDAMLLVFASDHYDADDYIRDYDDFLLQVQ